MTMLGRSDEVELTVVAHGRPDPRKAISFDPELKKSGWSLNAPSRLKQRHGPTAALVERGQASGKVLKWWIDEPGRVSERRRRPACKSRKVDKRFVFVP